MNNFRQIVMDEPSRAWIRVKRDGAERKDSKVNDGFRRNPSTRWKRRL